MESLEQNFEKPYLPRAVALPVGDMKISNISTKPNTVDLGSMGKLEHSRR